MTDPLLLSTREAADLVGVSVAHLRRLADCGRAPLPVRLGRSVRWSRSVLLEWIQAGCPRVDPHRTPAGRRR